MTRQEIHHIALRSEPSPRFQPTGFADLGAALYEQPGPNGKTTRMCLVESTQSMANHLESQGWDELVSQPLAPLDTVPWVRVVSQDGGYLTSSRTEAHRLYSAFLRNSTLGSESFLDLLCERFGLKQDRPVDIRQVALATFRLDPLSLVHGAFFAEGKWPHQPRLTRAITAFIEAEDVREAHSGGVKTDDVRRRQQAGGGSSEGYGMVPYHRTEYTAARITLHVALDIGLLHSYGLSDEAADLLETIARWELASLLSQQMRLRTACTLTVDGDVPRVFADPSRLAERITQLSSGCPELEDVTPITEVVWNPKGKK